MRLAIAIVVLWLLIYNDAQLFKALHHFLVTLIGA
jgi:hypothetical protein